MIINPSPRIYNAVKALEKALFGAETQVLWFNHGAVVITDAAVYEVFYNGADISIRQATLERGRDWVDVTGEVEIEFDSPSPIRAG
jgi:hypothetical protein